MNARLTSPVTAEEIKRAAFTVKGSSAPGEDDLTGVFYQKFWHIVGPRLTVEIQNFFETSIIPDGWNHTQLSLIPKILNPSRMEDMRPISLCSVQYKIISKILCNRLSHPAEDHLRHAGSLCVRSTDIRQHHNSTRDGPWTAY